uniref:Uncharacterized protein n=1 Tax=Romanomermis culicivorax TaxID=13658 RepID=A0A915KXB6_ROMCU
MKVEKREKKLNRSAAIGEKNAFFDVDVLSNENILLDSRRAAANLLAYNQAYHEREQQQQHQQRQQFLGLLAEVEGTNVVIVCGELWLPCREENDGCGRALVVAAFGASRGLFCTAMFISSVPTGWYCVCCDVRSRIVPSDCIVPKTADKRMGLVTLLVRIQIESSSIKTSEQNTFAPKNLNARFQTLQVDPAPN